MRRTVLRGVECLEARSLLSTGTGTSEPPAFATPSDLSATLTTDQRAYQLGQPVTMTLTETNISDHPVFVPVGAGAGEFFVTQGGVTVWNSSPVVSDGPFEEGTIAPGASMTIEVAIWDGTTNQDPSEQPTGTFAVHGPTTAAAPVTIEIQPTGSPSPNPTPVTPSDPPVANAAPPTVPTVNPDPPSSSPPLATPADPAVTLRTDHSTDQAGQPVTTAALPSTPSRRTTPAAMPLRVSVSTDKSDYPVGSPVAITITETNTGTQPVAVSGPIDVFITRRGVPVWRSPNGHAASTTAATLAAGQSVQTTITWLGRLAGHHHAPAIGKLVIVAEAGGTAGTAAIQFHK